jgi:8-oxo-dGTP pyrophosphatase MutT (NUDIX family)
VKSEEQPAQAVEREVREELGVAGIAGQLLYAETDPLTRHTTLYYRVTITGAPVCDGVEIDELRYVSSSDVPGLVGGTPLWVTLLEERKVS